LEFELALCFDFAAEVAEEGEIVEDDTKSVGCAGLLEVSPV
jgi:hypothetical protein